mgnify:FL=1
MLTLIEKAEQDFDQKKAKEMAKKIKHNGFDCNDFLESIRQMKKMGSLSSVVNMLPGMRGKLDDEQLDKGEQGIYRTEAIILSMTTKERERPDTINPSRKRRIAAGSGTRVEDVNRLLSTLQQSKKMMKKMGGKGKRRGRMPMLPF